MPGELKPSAVCPICGYDLILIADTSNMAGVRREYFHDKGSPKARRKRRCFRFFADHAEAAIERKGLGVVALPFFPEDAHYGRWPVPMPECIPRGRTHKRKGSAGA